MLNKENYHLVLSNEFINIIKRIDHRISDKLLFLNKNEDYGFPMSYIDIIDDNMISYTPSKKVIDIIKNNSKPTPIIWQSSRNEHRLGRFISKFEIDNDPNSIELFINKYKAEIKSLNNFDNFDIVEGDLISKYYHHNSYSKGGGPLNKSCMRHDHCQDFFHFYNLNNEKVKMVILYENDKKNKILGRALLWQIDDPKVTLLDRIYTSNDSDINLFIKFAKKNGWLYKSTQKFDEQKFIDLNGDEINLNCKIYLKDIEHKYFPYLDTFYFFDKKNNYITNDYNEYKNNKYIIKLRSTDGREQGNENFVYDVYNNDFINIEDSVYSIYDDTRIYKKDAIQIDNNYISPNSIRYSKYDNKIYYKNDVIWSNFQNSFINKKESFVVLLDEEGKTYDYMHSDFKGEYFEYVSTEDNYYDKQLVIKTSDNNFYLKSKYNEDEIKKQSELLDKFKKAKDLNNFFDEFIEKIGKIGNNYKINDIS